MVATMTALIVCCRLSAWEAEWRASGPRWSGHRS
jgi:hypothetical protein